MTYLHNSDTGPVTVLSHFTLPPQTNFLKFWKTLNDLQRSQGLPDLLYGDARGWFVQSGLPD